MITDDVIFTLFTKIINIIKCNQKLSFILVEQYHKCILDLSICRSVLIKAPLLGNI